MFYHFKLYICKYYTHKLKNWFIILTLWYWITIACMKKWEGQVQKKKPEGSLGAATYKRQGHIYRIQGSRKQDKIFV